VPYKIEVNQRIGKNIPKKWLSQIVGQTLKVTKVKNAEISIAFVGDKEIKRLNKQYRGKDKVTDVLSFDYRNGLAQIKTQKSAEINGEIVICYPQALRQAKEHGRNVKQEIKTLLVHGLLHLCGYEHEKNARQAREMEKTQNKILAGFC